MYLAKKIIKDYPQGMNARGCDKFELFYFHTTGRESRYLFLFRKSCDLFRSVVIIDGKSDRFHKLL